MKQDPKQRFRDLLAAAGWSQAEAARLLNMTPSGVSQIVRHNSTVKPSPTALRFLEVLVELKNTGKFLNAASGRRARGAHTKKWETDLLAHLHQVVPAVRNELSKAIIALIQVNAPRRQTRMADPKARKKSAFRLS